MVGAGRASHQVFIESTSSQCGSPGDGAAEWWRRLEQGWRRIHSEADGGDGSGRIDAGSGDTSGVTMDGSLRRVNPDGDGEGGNRLGVPQEEARWGGGLIGN
jgi:hypothetical protein